MSRLRRATAGGKPLAPPALLGATALRFALSLAGVLVLTLAWRSEAVAGLVGVVVGYLALLVAETRWAIWASSGRLRMSNSSGWPTSARATATR